MDTQNLIKAVFLSRPNRFLALCNIGTQQVTAHVPNTGRLRELFVPGATVYLRHAPAPGKKTEYSLLLVQKGERLIQIDSQAPNRLAQEAIQSGKIQLAGLEHPEQIKREVRFGDSRFDLQVSAQNRQGFVEVKGVTLEGDGHAFFPDAPTTRGVKHLVHLRHAVQQGYFAYLLFVVQMMGIHAFSPNWETHPDFAKELLAADAAGVQILAYGANITPEHAEICYPIPVILNPKENPSCL